MSQDAEYKEALSLPLIDRLEHHLWKIRVEAFEELVKEYTMAQSNKAFIFNDTGDANG